MSYLVDTNVISELRKGRRCDPGVAAWFARVASEEIYLSALTLGEIRRGIESVRRRDGAAAQALEAWFQGLVAAYSDRFLPVDLAVAEQWGRFNAPQPLPVLDSLLAATAKVHGLILVTRNEASGTTCHRRRRRRSPTPFSRWRAIDRRRRRQEPSGAIALSRSGPLESHREGR